MQAGNTIGFKYFECNGLTEIHLRIRGKAEGRFIVSTDYNGSIYGEIKISMDSGEWAMQGSAVNVPDGVNALYFKYDGTGSVDMLSFTLK